MLGQYASGFADSTSSDGETVQLSQFPLPPPVQAHPLLNSSNQSRNIPRPLPSVPVRGLPAVPESTPATHAPPSYESSSSSRLPSTRVASNTTASPYGWHEGASSVAMEDELLPTSFITSLLQENNGPRQRVSISSNAVSGISEMTYPPINPRSASCKIVRQSGPERGTQGTLPPPPSYHHIKDETFSGTCTEDPDSFASDAQISFVREADYAGNFIVDSAPVAFRGTSLQRKAPTKADKTQVNDSLTLQRQSISSTKSAAPSFLSKISSRKSIKQMFARKKAKPLPPVPLIPDIPIATEREHRKADDATPLPELLQRAGTLSDLLERGYHPHHSINSYHIIRNLSPSTEEVAASRLSGSDQQQPNTIIHRTRTWLNQRLTTFDPQRPAYRSGKAKRWFTILLVSLLVVLIIVAVGVAIAISKKAHSGIKCHGNFTGAACDLDATCICTSAAYGQCNGLAKSIVDLIPFLNDQFMVNFTVGDVYISLWQAQGSPSGSNCAMQALQIDVAPALDSLTEPNRTQWTRSAILWNLVESQDLDASQKLRTSVVHAPWNELAANKSIKRSAFSFSVSGYIFDFVSQTIVAPSQSFDAIAQPSAEQNGRVNSLMKTALDYVYGYAIASSTQRSKALANYWQSTLRRPLGELQTFRTVLSNSPILLPFDTTSGFMSSLLSTTAKSQLFPPPLACYPALNKTSLDRLNAVEHGIFNLPAVTPHPQFSTGCFPNHPVYGVLDIFQLRLPFSDSGEGFPGQAVMLQPAVSPRAILYNGELLSSLAVSSENISLTSQQQDPKRFGAVNNFDHVIYDYLSAMPNSTLANSLIDFALGNNLPHIPPPNGSILSSSLDSIPVIEVAIFGPIQPSDIQYVISSFTTMSGSLFFGSNYGSTLRQWTIAGINSTITWARSATSSQVVRESNLTDKVFEEIWSAASQAEYSPGAINNLTASLAAFGYFTP
ncbi:hypothetical protein APHAL10511_006301 [Amanita phalloides]|nr:hypothetical protein APHAL10511_006301 [Amanita phalloides]